MRNKSTLWIFFWQFAVLRRIDSSTCVFLLLCCSFVKAKDHKPKALLFITHSGKPSCNGFSTLRNLGKT